MIPGDALSVSASALSANRTRLNVIAENLANAHTTKTIGGGPYKRRVVRLEPEGPLFTQILGDANAEVRGVKVANVVAIPGTRRVHLPGHPDADKDGYVAFPRISPAEEMVNLMGASRGYQANVNALLAVRDMLHRSLDLLK